MIARLGSIVFLAVRYLRARPFATWVSIASVAVSLIFVVGVSLVDFGIKKTAVGGALRYPLIVGPGGSSGISLTFSTVFHIDKPSGTIPYEIYEKIKADDRVLAAYPLAISDSLRSYPIIGTNEEYVASLPAPVLFGSRRIEDPRDAVLGYEVALRTGLDVGDTFSGTHGAVGHEGAHVHDDFSYRVIGILASTSGPADAAVYVPCESVWSVHRHADEEHTHEEHAHEEHAHEEHAHEEGKTEKGALTAVLVRTRNPVYTAQLEAELSRTAGVTAVDTGRIIRKVVDYIKTGENLIRAFSAVTLAVAVAMILVTVLMSLAERRKELALMRSIGIGRATIAAIAVTETFLMTTAGAALGMLGGHVAVWWAQAPLKSALGVTVDPWVWTQMETFALVAALVAGQVLGLASLVWTYRMNLVEAIARD